MAAVRKALSLLLAAVLSANAAHAATPNVTLLVHGLRTNLDAPVDVAFGNGGTRSHRAGTG